MGNLYKNMVDIEIFYRLFRDIDTDAKEYPIKVNTNDYIVDLRGKIFEEIKKKSNDFSDIEADDLRLWKVEIDNNRNDKFSSLVLKDDNTKIIKLRETKRIGDYWDDKANHPKEGCTHVIINSPNLIKNRIIAEKDEKIEELFGRLSIQDNALPNEELNNDNTVIENSNNDIINGKAKKSLLDHSMLLRLFDGINIPNGKFQIKNGDKIKLDDIEVGEAVITEEKKYIKCKVTYTEKYSECTCETDVLEACNGGSRPHSTDVNPLRKRITIKDWSLYNLKKLVEDQKKSIIYYKQV